MPCKRIAEASLGAWQSVLARRAHGSDDLPFAFEKVPSGFEAETGKPFYCAILDGSCRLAINGYEPITLQGGDFVVIPSAFGFTVSSLEPSTSDDIDTPPVALPYGEFRLGIQSGPPDVRLLVGYCIFGSSNAAMLVSLLPQLVHVRGEKRLATLVQIVGEESRELRPARDIVLARYLEIRRNEGGVAAVAERVGYGSASAFSVAFTRHVGLAPTRYAREQLES